jgi:acetyl esterase/lipase
MIHAGADELRGDAELVTHRLLASGVPCDLHVWQEQVHSIAVAANATRDTLATYGIGTN